MALAESPDLRPYKDKDGNLQIETLAEARARQKKEYEEQYEKELKEIMKSGFSRKQAKYLHN